MWKQIFLLSILFLFVISSSLLGQEDSAYTMADTTKAIALFKSSDYYLKSSEYDTALEKVDSVILIYEAVYGAEPKEIISALQQKGKIYYYKGLYQEVLKYWNKALKICTEKDPQNIKRLLGVKGNIAVGYRKARRYEEAEQLYLEVIEGETKLYGLNNKESGKTYANLGNLYRSMNKFDEGLKALEKAIHIYSLHYEENDLISWNSYVHIGVIKEKQGKYEEALKNYRKVLKIQSLHLRPNHIRIVNTNERISLVLLLLGKHQEGLNILKKVAEDRLTILGENHPAIISGYINLGVAYGKNGFFEDRHKCNLKALKYSKSILGDKSIKTAKILYNIAYNNILMDKLLNVKVYLDESLEIYLDHYGSESHELAVHYNEYGVYYTKINHYEKAINYHSKALKLRLDHYQDEHHSSITYSYQNLGLVFWGMEDYEQAIANLMKATSINEKIGKADSPDNADILDNIGSIFSDLGDYEQSKIYHEKAYDLYQLNFPEGHPFMGNILHNIGKNFYRQKDYENAFISFHKTLGYTQSANVSESSFSFSTYEALGDLHGQLNNQDSCIYYYDKALVSINYINDASIHDIADKSKAISIIHSKARFYLYQAADYEQAQQYYEKAINAIELYLLISDEVMNVSNLSKYNAIYKEALETNQRRYKSIDGMALNAKNYQLSESLRAFYLKQALQNSKALSYSGIPDSLIQKENNLKVDIAYYDKIIQEKLLTGLLETDPVILALSSKIFKKDRVYEELMVQLENQYEAYYKAKYDLATISLEETQTTLLLSNQSLLEYIVGDSFLYTIVVNPDTFIIEETPMDFPLQEWVTDFREGLTKYHTSKDMPASMLATLSKQYVQNAIQLYDKLIRPVAPHLHDNLIVVPDGVLGYLPFEILLKDQPQKLSAFHSYPYLLKDYTINYCYSATLLHEMINRKHRQVASKTALAVAPFYNGNIVELLARVDTMQLLAIRSDTLQALNFSGEEVAIVAKMTNGNKWIGQEASLQKFKEVASNYSILHLSTHGIANDKIGDYAYLAFGNTQMKNQYEKLYLRDIYNLPLNADMVVLSACNTAYGKLQKGEGIISMARAFAYAGAKSIVTTHWSVDDASTGVLMNNFYRQLIKKNLPKDEALRIAKLQYIKTNKGLKAHPYFWAAFVGIGDMSPIEN